jgi:hypothetical protein
MNPSQCTLVFALGVSLVTACGDDDEGGASVQAVCEKGCSLEASLACPNDIPSTCVSECVEDAAEIPEACRRQVTTAGECIVNRPASDWECGGDGQAGPKEGVCAQEAVPAFVCLQQSSDGTCPFEDDDECDDPTGTDLCPAGTDVADCS